MRLSQIILMLCVANNINVSDSIRRPLQYQTRIPGDVCYFTGHIA